MRICGKVLLLTGVWALSLVGCGKKEAPMPLTSENVATYERNIEVAVKGINPKDLADVKGDQEKKKRVMYLCFIKPLEQMGYSYDKTIGDLAGKLLTKNLVTPDSATTMKVSDMLTFAKNSRETELKFGFISQDTKQQLDRVALIMPR